MGTERILRSTVSYAIYTDGADDERLEEYESAIADGTTLNQVGDVDEHHVARIVEYVDPVDGTTRYLLHIEDANESEWTDYATHAEAETEYERFLAGTDTLDGYERYVAA